MESIYGRYKDTLVRIQNEIMHRITSYNKRIKDQTGADIYEHLNTRIKGEDSMREKCNRRGIPETPESALGELTDSIGFRIVTNFIDDIYKNIDEIRSWPDCRVIAEKDYIKNAKPNGYRSYHMILEISWPEEDFRGDNPGHYYVEIQLRTIAMDSWASLEHTMKYKHVIQNQKMITAELKRCADELASCDVSMQTIRDLIRQSSEEAADTENEYDTDRKQA